MHPLKGFTLIEALITVTISGILISVALPSFAQLWRSQQLDSSTQTMLLSLALARQEAIKRGRALTIANKEGDWSNGWFLFLDDNNNGRHDPSESLLRSFPALPAGTSLTGNTHVRTYVRYTPSGSATLLNGGYQIGTLNVCHEDHVRGNAIVISHGGRARQSHGGAECPNGGR